MRLPFGHHLDALGRELVLDTADRDLVAWNLLGREHHRIAGIEADRMLTVRHPRQRRALFALPAGRNHQHLRARQPHRFLRTDRLRKVREVAGRTRDLQDAVERPSRNA